MIKLKTLLKESNRVKWLFEQEDPTTKTLPAIVFEGVFAPNYITPNNGYKKYAKQIADQINSYILPPDQGGQGYELTDIQISVIGYASDDNATNRFSGTAEPNHNFQTVGQTTGGLLPNPPGGWVADPNFLRKNSPTPGPNTYQRIGEPAGNNFLADQRSKTLLPLLTTEIERLIGQKLPEGVLLAKPMRGDKNKRAVEASVTPIISKTPKPISKPTFYIKYQWYFMESNPNQPLVMIGDAATPGNPAFKNLDVNKIGSASTNRLIIPASFISGIKNADVVTAGFQRNIHAEGAKPSAFIQINPDAMITDPYDGKGLVASYNTYEKWIADIQVMAQANYFSQGAVRTQLGPGKKGEIIKSTMGAAGGRYYPAGYTGYVPKHITLGKQGGGNANFFSKTSQQETSNTKPYYLFKPETEAPKYVKDLFIPNENPKNSIRTGAVLASNGRPTTLLGKQYEDMVYYGETKINRSMSASSGMEQLSTYKS